MFPLQIPGGPELIIILLIFVVPLAFVLALGVGVYLLGRGSDDDAAARLAAIEERLDSIETRLERRED